MILHKESHTDHVTPKVLEYLLKHFADRNKFFVEAIELPEGLTALCSLHGPAMGDAPIGESEVIYAERPGRAWRSRLVFRPARQTRTVTVVAGPHDGHPCVLYTTHGGPPAPQELDDPSLTDDKRDESEAFWAEHALTSGS